MSGRDFLHAAFHDPRTHAYRVVESTVWALILSSIALLVAEPFFEEGLDGHMYDYGWIVAQSRRIVDTRNATRDVKQGQEKIHKL